MQDLQLEGLDNVETNADTVEQHASTNGNGNAFPMPRVALSKRELQIVRMIGIGKTVGNIAVELNLSVKTVSTYRVRALHKLGMLTNADLMRYVIGQHLDEPAENNIQAAATYEDGIDTEIDTKIDTEIETNLETELQPVGSGADTDDMK